MSVHDRILDALAEAGLVAFGNDWTWRIRVAPDVKAGLLDLAKGFSVPNDSPVGEVDLVFGYPLVVDETAEQGTVVVERRP